ncbi:MAG: carboxypeptidase-like regulatory domain-containing protein, partial [Flavobacterium sp.]
MNKTVVKNRLLVLVMKMTFYQFVIALIFLNGTRANSLNADDKLGAKGNFPIIDMDLNKKSNPLDEKVIISNQSLLTSSQQQQKTLSGVVVDAGGLSLPGASVLVKGTKNSVSTDMDGKFSIRVDNTATILVISYVGFDTVEVSIANKTDFKITLKESSQALNEVVVVGYGTQKKGDVTSAVASVKAKDFNQGQVKDAGQLIQGKVAGLAITNASGDPTAVTSIKLRGNNTLSGAYTDPLVLIDGIPGALNTVAPEDIESIDVL